MARVTIQDCLEKIENPFALVRAASHRARDLSMGASSRLTASEHKPTVTALQEIAKGLVNDEGQLNTAHQDQQEWQDNQDEKEQQTEIDENRMLDEGDTAPASHEQNAEEENENNDDAQPTSEDANTADD